MKLHIIPTILGVSQKVVDTTLQAYRKNGFEWVEVKK
jgi:hypothetical protein